MRIILFLLLAQVGFSQSKQDALQFINHFYNHEHWLGSDKGGFKYNSFNNSVEYKMETVLKNPYEDEPKYTANTEVLFKISNVKNVILESEYYENSFITTFKIELYTPVKFHSLSKERGKMPELINRDDYSINFRIPKSITEEQFEDFKKAVRILLEK